MHRDSSNECSIFYAAAHFGVDRVIVLLQIGSWFPIDAFFMTPYSD